MSASNNDERIRQLEQTAAAANEWRKFSDSKIDELILAVNEMSDDIHDLVSEIRNQDSNYRIIKQETDKNTIFREKAELWEKDIEKNTSFREKAKPWVDSMKWIIITVAALAISNLLGFFLNKKTGHGRTINTDYSAFG